MIAMPDAATLETLDLDQLRIELAPLVAEAVNIALEIGNSGLPP